MPLLDASDDREKLEQALAQLPVHPDAEARKLFEAKKIKEGEIFVCDGVENFWKVGVFIATKLIVVKLPLNKGRRLPYLQRKAVARLLEIAETGYVPTALMSFMPQKFVSLRGGSTLYAPSTKKKTIEESREDKRVYDEDSNVDEIE